MTLVRYEELFRVREINMKVISIYVMLEMFPFDDGKIRDTDILLTDLQEKINFFAAVLLD